MKPRLKLRILSTSIVTLLVWAHILWDYFHGGIPTHYLFRDDNLPGIPNWLGGIVLPFFTWFLLYRIHKRINNTEISIASKGIRVVIIRFLLAMTISIMISIFFSFEIDIIDHIMLVIAIMAFIFPFYKSEYLLGWVVGSTFTFGAMIPMVFGSLLALIFYLVYKLPRVIINYFQSKKP